MAAKTKPTPIQAQAQAEASEQAAMESQAEAAPATHLLVQAKRDGFRRAGRAWSTTPETVPMADFTAAQIEALHAEPLLLVAVVVPEAA